MDSHVNFGSEIFVVTAPSPATTGTSIALTAGKLAILVAKGLTVPFQATIWPRTGDPDWDNAEIVRVTAISGDTITVTRAQESTTARTIVVGDRIHFGPTKKWWSDLEAISGQSGYSGYSGPQGTAGATGSTGATGTSGYSGYSGPAGPTGTGTSGYSGYSGPSGYSGYSGPQGSTGTTGITGTSGYSGYSGYSGPQGNAGTTGTSGFSGYSGYSGSAGSNGAAGVDGTSGYSGYSGKSGYSGYSGPSGYSGYSGPSGYSGYSGPSGYSGYSGPAGQDGVGTETRGARVYGSGDQNISSGSETALTFDTESYDTDSCHESITNPTRLTCNTAGKYIIQAECEMAASALGTERRLRVRLNGATIIAQENQLAFVAGTASKIAINTVYDFAANDYVEVLAFQDSTGTLAAAHGLEKTWFAFSRQSGTGSSGYSGYSGKSGYSGYSGPSGYSGYSGPSGYSGYSGPSGYSGYSGPGGAAGSDGATGTSGYSGYSGKSGYSGYSGPSGYSGYSGPSGYSGYSGPSGYSGYSGYSGKSGYSGYSGNGGSTPLGFANGDGTNSVTTGVKGYFIVPYAGTITGWNIVAAGSSPTCTIDVWKIATGTALPTVSNTIMGTKPALATGNAVRSSTLTSWTTSFSAGDIFGWKIDAVANATFIAFELEITKA